jgi:tRNA (cmo5U34)-methyltransferase
MPGYEALHSMAGDLLRLVLPEAGRILVVGAGTGMELVTLGRANPQWRFTAVDTSEDMLALCRGAIRVAGLEGRVELHAGAVDQLSQGEAFDAATSLLVSHFIKDLDQRESFFRAIASRLRPGGALVAADLAGDEADPFFGLLIDAWKTHYALAGIPEAEVREDFERTRNTVSFLPEDALVRLLTDSGFVDVRPFYRAFLFCGWVCRKPG